MSSFRERNDRSKPGGKPFSKGSKPAGKTGGGPDRGFERKNDREGDRPPKRSFEKRPVQGGYDPAAERGPPREDKRGHAARHKKNEGGGDWLWGWHAVQAALANPNRSGFKRLLVAPGKAGEVEAAAARLKIALVAAEPQDFTRALPSGAVHQGVALLADPVEPEDIETFADDPRGVLLMLDQLTDPQNVGAIFRSAAAFGARGVILQDRHAPALTGALAKAATGAIEAIPHARVVNLSRALTQLGEGGWRIVGLDGSAEQTLEEALDARPTVLVLGSEGEGLRRLVAEHCDTLARIPMPGGFESLNVSNAAAVALYEAARNGADRRVCLDPAHERARDLRMAKETVYIVQSYVAGRGQALKAEQQVGCKTAEDARRKAERLGPLRVGVVAFAATADVEMGDYDENPVILFKSGRLPFPFAEA